MLTLEQEQLARAVDSMRATDEINTKLALALVRAEADRDAYLKHLEASQAEVARLNERIASLQAQTHTVSQETTEKTQTRSSSPG